MATTPAAPLNTFIIYARDDRPYKDQLLRHLRPLTRNGLLRVWHDGDIQPGEDWEERIKTELAQSQLVLVLVSVHSLNSDFIENEELAIAVRQLRAGQARIVPILVGPCLWKYHPLLAGLQGLPTDLKPVEEWGNQNSAWLNVVEGLAEWAEVVSSGNEKASLVPESRTASVVPEGFVLVKGGAFQMGDLFGDGNEKGGEQPHTVTVDDFFLAKHALTFEEYDAFCESTKREKPRDEGWGRSQRPVINVSWYDTVEYCNWRSEQEGRTPAYTVNKNRQDPNNNGFSDTKKWLVSFESRTNGYRLPTEAEWEYAAREGGKNVRFGNGRDIIDPSEINFDARSGNKKAYSIVGEYRKKTVDVDCFSPNTLGFKQMSGNVWEWCWDWYVEMLYLEMVNTKNSTGPSTGINRVLRGGCWFNDPAHCRTASRFHFRPDSRFINLGFRLALSAPSLPL